MATPKDFYGYTPTWCPGCGDWGIGVSIRTALSQLGKDPSSMMAAFDIGCSGNMNDFVNAYAMHTLHGRSVVNAIGMKLANHISPVIVIGGDGAFYGEGGNHFIHACRGNHDITLIAHDNMVYGLTTGQVAPTAHQGYKSKSTPSGILEISVNPLALALTQGATFVAQAYAGNVPHLIEMIKAGIQHTGFSLVNVLQPCVTFNKVNTYQYYNKRVYTLDETYDRTNFESATQKVMEIREEKFPIGIIYQTERAAYHEQLPQLSDAALVDKNRFSNIESLINNFV